MKQRCSKVLFGVLFFALLFELSSFFVLWFQHDFRFPYKVLHPAISSAIGGVDVSSLHAADAGPDFIRQNILHPYLGFVRNYDVESHSFNGYPVREPVNQFGFFGATPRAGGGGQEFVILLTGGSVAAELYLRARKEFTSRLEEILDLRGKRIRLIPAALGGLKQPQQLMTLTWFLSMGIELDLVINLDGFNEVVIPYYENVPYGVSPYFPRHWRFYSSKSVNVDTVKSSGALTLKRQEQRALAAKISRKYFRFSHACLLLWEHRNRKYTEQIQTLESAVRKSLLSNDLLSAQERGPGYEFESVEKLLEDSVSMWERSSIQMSRLCGANEIPYVHFLQPNQYVQGSKTFSDWELEHAVAGEEYAYRSSAENGYSVLIASGERLRSQEVSFYDLTMIYKGESESVYRDRCCHLNNSGNSILIGHMVDAVAAKLVNGVAGAPRSN